MKRTHFQRFFCATDNGENVLILRTNELTVDTGKNVFHPIIYILLLAIVHYSFPFPVTRLHGLQA